MKQFKFLLLAVTLFSAAFLTDTKAQGYIDPSLVWSPNFGNQNAAFDSTGKLSVAGTACALCPQVVSTRSVSVTLTTAQLLAIKSTPDTILRAPADTGAIISVTSAYATLNYAGSAVFAADSVLQLQINGTTVAQQQDIIYQATTGTGSFSLVGTTHATPQISTGNPLLITSKNANLTGGAGNTLTVFITYNIFNAYTGKAE